MAVSGKRANVTFVQEIQQPPVAATETNRAGIIVGPAYQVIEALSGFTANPDAIAKDSAGFDLLYDGTYLQVVFYSDSSNLTGSVALPSLLDNSLILPNAEVSDDPFFTILLNPPGTDEFVTLTRGVDFQILTNSSGYTYGIEIFPGILDLSGVPFSSAKKANVVIGVRALRRDFVRSAVKLNSSDYATFFGDTTTNNPLGFAARKYFEASGDRPLYVIGVDHVTDSDPMGTYDAYLRALDVAATVDGYTLVVLTKDKGVKNAVKRHVIDLSSEDGARERIAYITEDLPTNAPNNILISGVGELSLVRATVQHVDTAVGYDIIGEAAQGGSAVNGNLEFEIIDSGSGGLKVEHAGGKILVDTGVTADGNVSGNQLTSAASTDFLAAGVVVGDVLEYTHTSTSSEGVIGPDRFQDANVNFSDLGISPGDDLTISGGTFAGTYKILAISTTTNPNDTLVVDATFSGTSVAGEAYDIVVTVPIKAISGASNHVLTVDGVFYTAGPIPYRVLSSSSNSIIVDLGGDTPDSQAVVSLLNSNTDVIRLATFYVGPDAITGSVVGTTSTPAPTFTGGVDSWTQFYTNSDLSALSLSPAKYLDLESENRDFAITAIRTYNGSVIVSDPNNDLDGLKVSESFSIYEQGAPLTITTPLGTEEDIQGQADALSALPALYKHRRVRLLWPDEFVTEVDGVTVTVDSYYAAASVAGLIAALPPSQGHSELALPGWDGVKNSNDRFSEKQLEQMTAAGMWIYVQDVEGGPVVCRKQYTTDTTNDTTAEGSITVVVDSFQKDVRASVRPLLGVNNITPALIDQIRFLIESVGQRYIANGDLKSASLNSITASETDITALEADMTLEPYPPANKVRIKVRF